MMIDVFMVTTDDFQVFASVILLPISLVLCSYVMIYTIYIYRTRLKEIPIRLLITASIVAFLTQVPYASQNKEMVMSLSDASDDCLIIAFLLRIIIITRDVNKKLRDRMLTNILWIAYVDISLTFFDFIVRMISIGGVEEKKLNFMPDIWNNIFETMSMLFITFFRFYFLLKIENWRYILSSRKVDIFVYFLFCTHEALTYCLEVISSWDLESFACIYMRGLIVIIFILSERRQIKMTNTKYQSKTPVSVSPDHPPS